MQLRTNHVDRVVVHRLRYGHRCPWNHERIEYELHVRTRDLRRKLRQRNASVVGLQIVADVLRRLEQRDRESRLIVEIEEARNLQLHDLNACMA